MKKCFVPFLMSLLSVFIISCSNNDKPVQTYDGRVFDISEKQDKSLTVTSNKVEYNYTLTISGSGSGVDYKKKEEAPWNPICKKVKSVTINEGITHIGDYYFYSINQEYYVLPSTVTSVGDHTFNPDSIIYTYGGELNNIANVYYYSETKPSQTGKYFYMLDGVPHVWAVTSFLFIGNSFTYYPTGEATPAVPNYFQKIAENLNQEVNIDYVVKGSHTLTKFANTSDEMGSIVEQKLTTNKYDYVILQEQSTTPINNYNAFLTAVQKLKKRIDETQEKCKTVLYETWGSPTAIKGTTYATVGEMEAALREAYKNVGKECECQVDYVGKAFTYAYETLNINIYYSDDRHQNNFGAYLSAAVHVKSIFNLKVTLCTEYCGLDETTCKALLDVADKN